MPFMAPAAALALLLAAAAAEPIQAPDVEMRDGQGRRVRLSDFRGNLVLVDLWASWCPPCKLSFPALDRLYEEYRARGLVVIAVNLDERRRDAETFLKAHPHEMRVVFDPRARVLKAFGAPGIPSAYLIDRQASSGTRTRATPLRRSRSTAGR
jgi:cytochrome c biogenesis protein CcmG, thiol:disulfide interchange protein DsbE